MIEESNLEPFKRDISRILTNHYANPHFSIDINSLTEDQIKEYKKIFVCLQIVGTTDDENISKIKRIAKFAKSKFFAIYFINAKYETVIHEELINHFGMLPF